MNSTIRDVVEFNCLDRIRTKYDFSLHWEFVNKGPKLVYSMIQQDSLEQFTKTFDALYIRA